MEPAQDLGSRFVGVQFHIVAHPVSREETIDSARLNQFFADHFFQKFLRVGEQLARLLAVFLVLQNFWINAAQFPRMEKRRPVDEGNQIGQRNPVAWLPA